MLINLPPQVADRAREALACIKPELQTRLANFGGTIRHSPFGNGELEYDLSRRDIGIVQYDESNFKRQLLHELTHMLDQEEGRKGMSALQIALTAPTDQLASRKDPKLLELYRGYLARSSVDYAQMLADKLQAANRKGGTLCPLEREYQVRLEQGPPRIIMEETTPAVGLLACSLSALRATVATEGVGLLVACTISPWAGLPIMLFGALRYGRSAYKAVAQELDLARFQAQVGEARVSSRVGRWEVQLPATPQAPALLTDYATLTRRPEEYFAESMSHFLAGGELRAQLQRVDPAMYDYCAAKGWHSR